MKPIKVLIFDDVQDDLDETKDALKLGWSTLKNEEIVELPELELDTMQDWRGMEEITRKSNFDCSVFLCDIIVDHDGDGNPMKKETRGFKYLQSAKKSGVPVCILLSHGDSGMYAKFETQKTNFSESIDLDWIKDNLYDAVGYGTRARLMAELLLKLRSRGLAEAIAHSLVMSNHMEEARTFSLLEEVGRETLNTFAATWTLRGANEYKLQVLTPGLSGAKIVQLEFIGPGQDFTDRNQIVKISRDKSALQKELDSFKRLNDDGHHVASAVARPSTGEVKAANDWFAIAFRGVPSALTFVNWLEQTNRSTEQVERALDFLYRRDGLSRMYKASAKTVGNAIEVLREKSLSRLRQIGIFSAIDELDELINKYGQGIGWDKELIENFLEAGSVGTIPHLTKFWESQLALCHGDFHGRNVLVEVDGEANRLHIIDLASMGENLWPTDVVRLCVDVAMTSWDRGSMSYEWDKLADWSSLIDTLLGEEPEVGVNNACAAAAIRWLRKNAFANHGLIETPQRVSEYNLALAVELLRASYRTLDLPAPKRALALIGAALVLKQVAKANKRNQPPGPR